MQTNRGESYIRRDFGFYDSGILGCLPSILFDVYEILRRWVWRSLEAGEQAARDLYASGKLAVTVTQEHIAEYLDRDRKTINGHLAIMKDLGWIRVLDCDRGPSTYILGDRVSDNEMYYADVWMGGLVSRLEYEAHSNYGEAKISKLALPRRREVCMEYVAGTGTGTGPGGGSISVAVGERCPENRTEQMAFLTCPENRTGKVSRKIDTNIANEEGIANLRKEEEKKKKEEEPDGRQEPAGTRALRARLTPRSHWDRPTSTKARTAGAPIPPTTSNSTVLNNNTSTTVRTSTHSPLFSPYAEPTVVVEGPANCKPAYVNSDDRLDRLRSIASGSEKAGPASSISYPESSWREKSDRAHLAALKKKDAREAKRNRKSEDENSIREAHRYLRKVWEHETREYFGPGYPTFGPAEYNQIDTLLESYTQAQIAGAISYLVQQWDKIRTRVLKNSTDKLTLSFLHRFHQLVLAEAQDYEGLIKVHREWTEWLAANPRKFPPKELSERYKAVEPQLKALGLV